MTDTLFIVGDWRRAEALQRRLGPLAKCITPANMLEHVRGMELGSIYAEIPITAYAEGELRARLRKPGAGLVTDWKVVDDALGALFAIRETKPPADDR